MSIVQIAKGVPVATFAIYIGFNAALLAIRILAVEDEGVKDKLEGYGRGGGFLPPCRLADCQ